MAKILAFFSAIDFPSDALAIFSCPGCVPLLTAAPDTLANFDSTSSREGFPQHNRHAVEFLEHIATLQADFQVFAQAVLRVILGLIAVRFDQVGVEQEADVFVFAWRSSKHQAYYCVKENRGDRPLSMPAGKGAASIVHAAMVAMEALLLN